MLALSRDKDGVCHGLREHLQGAAAMAREMAYQFGAGELGYWAGLWHALGKSSDWAALSVWAR